MVEISFLHVPYYYVVILDLWILRRLIKELLIEALLGIHDDNAGWAKCLPLQIIDQAEKRYIRFVGRNNDIYCTHFVTFVKQGQAQQSPALIENLYILVISPQKEL
jgi:hypothetical protein